MDAQYNLNGGFQPTTKRRADLDGPDFYPTPRWATKALLENEPFEGDVWECACGDGAMAEVIASRGHSVYGSDLFDRGYGDVGVDFLETDQKFDNVITNPPFHSAEAFVRKGLESSRSKVALLLRLAFLESANRYRSIFSVSPPSSVWVFSERITFYPKDAERRGSGTTAYAWFVWDHAADKQTKLKWLSPGYKSRG